MKLCGCQDTCPMRLYSKFQVPGWSGTFQAGQRLILKNLPCKSPRFLVFFQRLCFYGYLEAFSGQVQESRPCLTFDFTYWDMFFDLKKSSGGCQEASKSWHVLNFLSFWLHQITQTGKKSPDWVLEAWDQHQKMPVNGGILIYVPHLRSSTHPWWATRWTTTRTSWRSSTGHTLKWFFAIFLSLIWSLIMF